MSGPVNPWFEVLRAVPGMAVARYQEAFERLWSDEWASSVFANERQLVVLWEEQPDGDRLLLDHLTPLDWALAVSHQALQDTGSEKNRDWSLHIVDLTFGKHKNTWAIRHAASLLDAMPWVRLYAPLQLKRRAYERFEIPRQGEAWNPGTPSLAETCARLGRESVREGVRGMVRTWQGSLQRREDHHDLNNSVGAYVLLDLLGVDPTDAGLRPADARPFLQRVRWTTREQSVKRLDRPKAAVQIEGPARVIVVDDQINEGWAAVAAHLLGAQRGSDHRPMDYDEWREFAASEDRRVKVYGSKDASLLVKKLEKAQFDRRDIKFQYADFSAQEDAKPPELILLDLRLAATRDRDAQDRERKQIRRLVEIAGKCCLEGAPGLAWSGISARAIQAVRDWCGGEDPSGHGEIQAVTLLARIMALATPQTPIIVFSATGRAEIKSLLRPYGSVLTGFEKPRPLDPLQGVETILASWEQELATANRILRASRELRAIQTTAQYAKAVLPRWRKNLPASEIHLECYYDESGTLKNGMTASALAVAYESEEAAERLNQALSATVIELPVSSKLTLKYNLVWAGAPTEPGVRLLPKFADDVILDLFREVEYRVKGKAALPLVNLPADAQGVEVPIWGLAASAIESLLYEDMPRELRDWLKTMAAQSGSAHGATDHSIRVFGPYDTLLDPDVALATLLEATMSRLKKVALERVYDNRRNRKRARALIAAPTAIGRELSRLVKHPWQEAIVATLNAIVGGVTDNTDLGERLEQAVADGLRRVMGEMVGLVAFHAEIPAAEQSDDAFVDAALDRRLSLIAEAAIYDCLPLMLGGEPASYRHFFATRKFGERTFDRAEMQLQYSRWGAVPWYENSNQELREVLKSAAEADRDDHLSALGRFFENQNPPQNTPQSAVRELQSALEQLKRRQVITRTPPYRRLQDMMDLPYRRYVNPREFLEPAKIESYGCSSYGPLARAIAYRRARSGGPKLKGAVGVRLNSNQVADQRQLHALGDWIPRVHGQVNSPVTDLVRTQFVLAGGRDSLDVYDNLLRACGLVDAGRGPLAVQLLCGTDWRNVASHVSVGQRKGLYPLSLPLICKIAKAIPELSGPQIIELQSEHALVDPPVNERHEWATTEELELIPQTLVPLAPSRVRATEAEATRRLSGDRDQRRFPREFLVSPDLPLDRLFSRPNQGMRWLKDAGLIGHATLTRTNTHWVLRCDDECGTEQEIHRKIAQAESQMPGVDSATIDEPRQRVEAADAGETSDVVARATTDRSKGAGPELATLVLLRGPLDNEASLRSKVENVLKVRDPQIERLPNRNLRVSFNASRQMEDFWRALAKLHENRRVELAPDLLNWLPRRPPPRRK